LLKAHYGKTFREARVRGKTFDFVSGNGEIVGELIMARGNRPPTSYFPYIASTLWFLEKTEANEKIIVFYRDETVPKEWMKRFGHLTKDIKFFLNAERGALTPIRRGFSPLIDALETRLREKGGREENRI